MTYFSPSSDCIFTANICVDNRSHHHHPAPNTVKTGHIRFVMTDKEEKVNNLPTDC